jgi:hypothetical protein
VGSNTAWRALRAPWPRTWRHRHPEELVADVVAETVVDQLEVVQIDEEQADLLPSPPERGLQPVLEQQPVRQAGQRVVERLLRQPLLVQRPLGDITIVEHQTADGRVVEKVGGGHLEAPGRLLVPEGPHADLPNGGHPWPRLAAREQFPGDVLVVRLDEVQQRAADDLLGRVAEHLLDRGALVADDGIGADHREHVRGVMHQGLEALLALAQVGPALVEPARHSEFLER